MGVVKLSKEGKAFIRSVCKGTGNSKLSGKNSYVLPYCTPKTSSIKVWTSNPNINGGIETNSQLAEKLIELYNKYAITYSMDANIMAAQAYQESLYNIWNYAKTSSASGISQFISGTIWDVIMRNRYGGFTDADKIAISKNMIGYTYSSNTNPPKEPFVVENTLGSQNRPILHQNIIDNIDIMVKAQFIYMKFIGSRCNSVASCSLFGYNRGAYIANTNSYTEWIYKSREYGTNYEVEGINYVYKIFKFLYNDFGYTFLDMEDGNDNFQDFNSNLG